jgi:hypothetical protein
MSLKNYSSSVSAMRSISFIETRLSKQGATQIIKQFDGAGRTTSLSFTIDIRQGDRMVPVHFKLPANVDKCEKVLRANFTSRTQPETRRKVAEQAERTAWKIIADWIDAQMAMIELSQVEVLQVMLAYVYNPAKDQTLFEQMEEGQFKGLSHGGEQ